MDNLKINIKAILIFMLVGMLIIPYYVVKLVKG